MQLNRFNNFIKTVNVYFKISMESLRKKTESSMSTMFSSLLRGQK